MSTTERFSHPGTGEADPVPLLAHLEDVAERIVRLVPVQAQTPSETSLVEIGRRIAWMHDFGKLTRAFQEKIGLQAANVEDPDHHAPLGALASHHVLEALDYEASEQLAGFLAVARHHGRLPNVAEFLASRVSKSSGRGSSYREDARIQVEDIDEHVPDLADRLLTRASDDATDWSTFRDRVLDGSIQQAISDHASSSATRFGNLGDSAGLDTEDLYQLTYPLWSALTLADKTSAASVPKEAYRPDVPAEESIVDHVDSLQAEASTASESVQAINGLRDNARREVIEQATGFARMDDNVATLTLPTGLGKTLTGLQAALRVRDEKQALGDQPGRVVYALPYTSIVDQVASEAREVFDADPTGRLLTIHHHLAETRHGIEDADDTDERARLEELLGETWRSGLVVTTFVQLFESLVGSSNTQAMKLASLHDAVIVLDEPQVLQHDWWLLVRRLSQVLGDRFNADVIAMTATQPRLFTHEDVQAPELVPDPDDYFRALNRVSFRLHPSAESHLENAGNPLGYDAAAREVALEVEAGSSSLAVCNTIDAARNLAARLRDAVDTFNVQQAYARTLPFRESEEKALDRLAARIADEAGNQDRVPVLQLTTRNRPRDRRCLIGLAKRLLADEVPLALVSTQLVEAGVDVSFDTVFRDLAPMDSIVQAAGRCNRSAGGDTGTVTVWWLEAPEDQDSTPAEAVYARFGENLLAHTARALEAVRDDEDEPLSEPCVTRDSVRAYYESLDTANPGDRSMVDDLENARFEELADRSLINQPGSVEIVVVRTEPERLLCENVRECFDEEAYDDARSLVRELRDLQVSVPVYESDSREAAKLSKLEPLHQETDLKLIDLSGGGSVDYVDAVTGGVIVPDTSVEARFL